ncbi:zeta toxin family protein [bacterium]|nr:zeta toxin family protein [bacterium]
MLQRRVRNCKGDAEYEMLKQQWSNANRLQYQRCHWSARRQEVLEACDQALACDDEGQNRQQQRAIFVAGGPASGKSAVPLEVDVRSTKRGIRALIVCPTSQLVNSFKCQLPGVDGIENTKFIPSSWGTCGLAHVARWNGPRLQLCAVSI